MRDNILSFAEANPLFGLAIAFEPRARTKMVARGRLTLIEFERALEIPTYFGSAASFTMPERCAVAAIRLIIKAALEQLYEAKGGVLIADEAHVFLSSQEGRSILQNLGRTGRSQGILPILATQRLADLVSEGVDMGSYMGRVMVMKMTDERETNAALKLLNLEATDERKQFLRQAGPVHPKPEANFHGRPAMALLRDLNDKCSAVLLGPYPESTRLRFSTNLADRQLRKK